MRLQRIVSHNMVSEIQKKTPCRRSRKKAAFPADRKINGKRMGRIKTGNYARPIHLFIKATPSDSIAHIVSQLKGYTSYILRSEFPHLKQRVPTLWTRSYYVETIGHISEKTILKYIEDQKKK